MLPKTVRGAVDVAAGLVEEVGKRVVGTAAGLLEKGGLDVAELERRLGGQFPPSAESLQTLAEEALTAGRAGVDLAVGVARGEVEKAFERVGDQVTKVGVVLAYLESKLREVEEEGVAPTPKPGAGAEEPGPAPRADGLFGQGWEREDEPAAPAARAVGEPIVAERVEVDAPVEVDPPVPPARAGRAVQEPVAERPARKAPAKRAGASEPASRAASRAVSKTASKTPSKPAPKPAAKKATAKKATANRTTTTKATARKAAADTTTVRKPAAKDAATENGAAKDAAARKAVTKKAAVKKTAAVRKTGGAKKPEQPDA
ncbi:hypothetical protein ACIBJD_37525 [Kitasatospora sp. NPDC050467]|uniref:hypothetical protein n=1 Tax=Kitasatospora sp. NPDC050467 TaxID=3364053 RepID=UPI00378E74DE